MGKIAGRIKINDVQFCFAVSILFLQIILQILLTQLDELDCQFSATLAIGLVSISRKCLQGPCILGFVVYISPLDNERFIIMKIKVHFQFLFLIIVISFRIDLIEMAEHNEFH